MDSNRINPGMAGLLTRQLANPSGFIGRIILPHIWNRRNKALNERVLLNLDLKPSDRVLEVGFGGGYLLARMAHHLSTGELNGVDRSPAMVAAARHHLRKRAASIPLELSCAAAENLPFPANQFDKAVSVNSLFYWHDAHQALGELFRVLVPGGLFVVCLTCKDDLEKKSFAHHGLTLVTPDQLGGIIRMNGYENTSIEFAHDRHRQFFCLSAYKPLRLQHES